MSNMLKPALAYHDEGLCVIPIWPRQKAPALKIWDQYQITRSTRKEIISWFGNGKQYNIGIVHGEVSHNYTTIDIDYDQGIFAEFKDKFPAYCLGRIEQSGSSKGYHIPLQADILPDFGWDQRKGRPRGNKTWKTDKGDINLRCRFCQTVAPPSIHPCGGVYQLVQQGHLGFVYSYDPIIEWLEEIAPHPKNPPPPPSPYSLPIRQDGNDLLSAVRSYWNDALSVFRHFGLANKSEDKDGQIRLLGNGGLLVRIDNPETWYCFADETGGGVFEAWGWCKYGTGYDKHRHFREVLIEMAGVAGIDVTRFYQHGDEQLQVQQSGDRWFWTNQYNVWGKLR